jgi:orotidine-5'-phosphate decarboxylase
MNAILAKLNARIEAADTLVCVGLDPETGKLPQVFRESETPLYDFCRHIIDRTAEFAAAYKPNIAFFEAHGAKGIAQLELVASYLHEQHPDIVTICDAKRGDNANTNRGYVTAIFDHMGFDAVTLHPYLGSEALAPFLVREEKASIILCRTSNVGAREVQDLESGGEPLWKVIAHKVSREWDRGGNCWLVVGATYPAEMRALRELAPHTVFLVPGIGAQGGDLAAVLAAGLDAQGRGLLISSSRAICEAADPATAARNLRDEINAHRATPASTGSGL